MLPPIGIDDGSVLTAVVDFSVAFENPSAEEKQNIEEVPTTETKPEEKLEEIKEQIKELESKYIVNVIGKDKGFYVVELKKCL